MAPRTRRRVRVLYKEREAQRFLRIAAPFERWREIGPVAGVKCRDPSALAERGGKDFKCHSDDRSATFGRLAPGCVTHPPRICCKTCFVRLSPAISNTLAS